MIEIGVHFREVVAKLKQGITFYGSLCIRRVMGIKFAQEPTLTAFINIPDTFSIALT